MNIKFESFKIPIGIREKYHFQSIFRDEVAALPLDGAGCRPIEPDAWLNEILAGESRGIGPGKLLRAPIEGTGANK